MPNVKDAGALMRREAQVVGQMMIAGDEYSAARPDQRLLDR